MREMVAERSSGVRTGRIVNWNGGYARVARGPGRAEDEVGIFSI